MNAFFRLCLTAAFCAVLINASMQLAYADTNQSSAFEDSMRSGRLSYGAAKYSAAINDFTQALASSENNTEVYYWRGLAYFQDGNYKNAIDDLSHAITQNPNYRDAHLIRAMAYKENKQAKQALQDICWVTDRDSIFKEAFEKEADIYSQLGDSTHSKEAREKASKLSARFWIAQGELAQADFAAYMSALRSQIKSAWLPPRGKESKAAVLQFVLHRDHRITDIKVKKTSDDPYFDQCAINTVKSLRVANPFPPGSVSPLTIEFTFDFSNIPPAPGVDRQDTYGETNAEIDPVNMLVSFAGLLFLLFGAVSILVGAIFVFLKGKRRIATFLIPAGLGVVVVGLFAPEAYRIYSQDPRAVQQADKEIAEGAAAARKAVAKQIGSSPHVFSAGENSFELLPPEGFLLEETPTPFGKAFIFTGPRRADGSAALFAVTVFDPASSQDRPSVTEMLDMMVAPFREHLSWFQQHQEKTLNIKGHDFEGVSFSGVQNMFLPISGFFYAAPIGKNVLVVNGQDDSSHYVHSASLFMKTFSTLKILK
jgi:TonB family protein